MVRDSTPNCAYLLDNGQPCRAPALHGHAWCRHHTPEALARRPHPLHPPASEPVRLNAQPHGPSNVPSDDESPIPPSTLRAYWRMHHRIIATADAASCDEIFEMILSGLESHHISPRSGGRLLQAILDRKNALARAEQQAAFHALEQKLSAQTRSMQSHPSAAVPAQAHTSGSSQFLEPSASTAFCPGQPASPGLKPSTSTLIPTLSV